MAICKYCGAHIEWVVNPDGRWEPYDLNKMSHWRTCPKYQRIRQAYKNNNGCADYDELVRKKLHKDQVQLNEFNKKKN